MSESASAKIGMIERFRLGKGITREAEGAWTKMYIEVEVKLPENASDQDLVANLTATEYMIDQLLQAPATAAPTEKPTSKPAAMPSPQLPQLDPAELAELPWRTYKTKENCKPDEAGWIFRNTPGAEALADLIVQLGKDAIVQMGAYKFEVKFSGAERQFISRKPVK